jgi:integrase
MTNPKHTIRRGAKYSFKFNVPEDVREYFEGKSQIVIALGTDSPSQAAVKAQELYAEQTAKVEDARRAGIVISVEPLDMSQLPTYQRRDLEYGISTLEEVDKVIVTQLLGAQFDDAETMTEALNTPNIITATIKGRPTPQEVRKSLEGARNQIAEHIAILEAELNRGLSPVVREQLAALLAGHETFHPNATRNVSSVQYDANASDRTFQMILDEWSVEKPAGADMLGKRVRFVKQFAKHCGVTLDDVMPTVSNKANAKAWRLALQSSGKKSVNATFATVKDFFSFAVAEGDLPTNPAEGMSIAKTKSTKSVFTVEEMRDVILPLTHEQRFKHGDAFRFAAFMGWRMDEVLKLDDTCFTDIGGVQVVEVRGGKTKHTERVVPLPDAVLNDTDIMKRVATTGRTFSADLKANRSGSYTGPVSSAFNGHFHDAFASKVDESGGKKTMHAMRHTFTTLWEVLELDDKLGMEVTGHSKADVTSAVHASYICDEHVMRDVKRLGKKKALMNQICERLLKG